MKNIIAVVAAVVFLGLIYHIMSGNTQSVQEGVPTEKVEFTPQPIEEVVESTEDELDSIETLEAEVDSDIEELENLDF